MGDYCARCGCNRGPLVQSDFDPDVAFCLDLDECEFRYECQARQDEEYLDEAA